MEQYKFREIKDSTKDIFRQHLSKKSEFYNFSVKSIKAFIISHGICRFYDKDHDYINTYGLSSKISKKYDVYEYEVLLRNGEYLYLVYIFDDLNNPTGIIFTRSEFYKYCKLIINKPKDTPLWETIKSIKETNQKEDLNVTFNEIQDAIKEFRDNDLEELKWLKEDKHTIKDKINEINIENFFKIKTNIYR